MTGSTRWSLALAAALTIVGCSSTEQTASLDDVAFGMIGPTEAGMTAGSGQSQVWTLWAGDALGNEIMAYYVASLDRDYRFANVPADQ